MTISRINRDLSDVGYWTLDAWRASAEEQIEFEQHWLEDLTAEIARRNEQFRLCGQSPPDGYDIHYSPMWQEGCNNACLYECRITDRRAWVETAHEKESREGYEKWQKLDRNSARGRMKQQQ